VIPAPGLDVRELQALGKPRERVRQAVGQRGVDLSTLTPVSRWKLARELCAEVRPLSAETIDEHLAALQREARGSQERRPAPVRETQITEKTMSATKPTVREEVVAWVVADGIDVRAACSDAWKRKVAKATGCSVSAVETAFYKLRKERQAAEQDEPTQRRAVNDLASLPCEQCGERPRVVGGVWCDTCNQIERELAASAPERTEEQRRITELEAEALFCRTQMEAAAARAKAAEAERDTFQRFVEQCQFGAARTMDLLAAAGITSELTLVAAVQRLITDRDERLATVQVTTDRLREALETEHTRALQAEAEVARLQAVTTAQETALYELRRERDSYHHALEFYAEETSWACEDPSTERVIGDGGREARQALGGARSPNPADGALAQVCPHGHVYGTDRETCPVCELAEVREVRDLTAAHNDHLEKQLEELRAEAERLRNALPDASIPLSLVARTVEALLGPDPRFCEVLAGRLLAGTMITGGAA
jgi:hypothetical protein